MDSRDIYQGPVTLDELKRRVGLYVEVRWLYLGAVGIAGLIPLYVASRTTNASFFPGLCALAAGMLSNLLFWLLSKTKRRGMIYFQTLASLFLLVDLGLIAFAVSLGSATGYRGLVLFAIPILLASMLYGRRATYAMAGLSGVTLMIIFYHGQKAGTMFQPNLWVAAIFYTAIFATIAALAGYMSAVAQGQQVERAKTDLIALASHQLRTPATAVKGFLSLVLQNMYGNVPDKQRPQIAQAYLENERQLNLITSLLNVSSLDRGELAIDKSDVDLAGPSGMLADIVAEHLELTRSRQITLKMDIPKESVFIHADREKIRLVFQNLVNNACKFAPEGSTVECQLTDRGKDVVFTVADHGKGISAENQRKLFQRFSRVGGASTVQGEGAGLGLFISRRIVELHNGTISVKSSPGKGTTFTVILPKK